MLPAGAYDGGQEGLEDHVGIQGAEAPRGRQHSSGEFVFEKRLRGCKRLLRN